MKLKIVASAVLALSAGFASAQTVVTIAHVGPTSGADCTPRQGQRKRRENGR